MNLLRILALPITATGDLMDSICGGLGPSRVRQLLDDERDEQALIRLVKALKELDAKEKK